VQRGPDGGLVKALEARKLLRVLMKRGAAFPTMLFSMELMSLLGEAQLVESSGTARRENPGRRSGKGDGGHIAAIHAARPFRRRMRRSAAFLACTIRPIKG